MPGQGPARHQSDSRRRDQILEKSDFALGLFYKPVIFLDFLTIILFNYTGTSFLSGLIPPLGIGLGDERIPDLILK